MAKVIFYEKPGCINNTRQKKLLSEAGHEVEARNLLTEAWQPERLKPFLQRGKCDTWINRSHPDIKSGALKLPLTEPGTVLQALCSEPLLIRRPLMAISGDYFQGFDADMLDRLIGLRTLPEGDIESCPRSHTENSCDR